MNKYKYNSWPLGKVPEELQRPEIKKLRDLGYKFEDAREVVDIFESKVANLAGCKYAVTTDCCTHGMFLSLKYLQDIGELDGLEYITIPRHTYVSAAIQILHLGYKVEYEDLEWSGVYRMSPTRVWDGAVRWTKGMYVGNSALQVVSFQFKKRIPIGKGGIILTDDAEAARVLKLMSYDGRDLTLPYTHPDHMKTLGYHMYMTPEDAARGIILMDSTPEVNEDSGNNTMYPDVKEMLRRLV
jgi:dTDP-4-amino-4,6-dideoxygalactose transaminase